MGGSLGAGIAFAFAFLLADDAAVLPPDWHARAVFIDEARIDTLRSRIADRTEPTWTAWQQVLGAAEEALDQPPHAPARWYVPGYYKDPDGHRAAKEGLESDANTAYALALAYRMTEDVRYAEAAARLLNAWATQVQTLDKEQDSGLSFSYHFPAFIIAADLLRDAVWPEPDQQAFRTFVREKALPQNTMDRANNWGNWGLVLVLASAAYLDDRALFERGIARWKEFIEMQIAEEGSLTHEVTRGGFGRKGDYGMWYSHFSLMPQTIAAEIARVNGIELYDYVSPNGRSLLKAYEWLAPFVNQPATFPYFQGGDVAQLRGVDYVSYFEILNTRWPNADATASLARLRPLSARHATPFLTFTHGDPP